MLRRQSDSLRYIMWPKVSQSLVFTGYALEGVAAMEVRARIYKAGGTNPSGLNQFRWQLYSGLVLEILLDDIWGAPCVSPRLTKIFTSTRRFSARPARVLLSATGCDSP
jgi:hypothetical protein